MAWDLGPDGAQWESYTKMTETLGESLIYTTVNGLNSGVTYQFKYRAENIHGWSTGYSDSVSVKTLVEPSTIDVPVTSNQGDSVKIKWSAPYTGGLGIPITSYEIQILDSSGNFITTPECDGSDSTVISDTSCTILMDTLTGADFNLVLGDLVVAKVKATNEKGSG